MDELALTGVEGGASAAAPAPEPAAGPTPGDDRWSPVAGLPTIVTVSVPIPRFRVRDVLSLRPGSIVASAWRGGREVPLSVGQVEFAWSEFEVTDETLSARITRLSGE